MTQSPIADIQIDESQKSQLSTGQKIEAKRKGKEGESKFENWLDKHDISYIRFDQTPESFSKVLRGKSKRPDFMILIPNFGFILVDVKCLKIYTDDNKGNYITLNKNDIDKYIELHREFGVPIWFAVINKTIDVQSLYWMSINEFDIGEKEYTNWKTKGKYYKIKKDRFCEIAWDDGLEKLFENKK